MFRLLYPFILLLKKSKNLSALSCRLTKLTGKSKHPLHPKHLVVVEKPWYITHIKSWDFVLDLGCGNGQHTLKAAKKCKKIIGLDYDSGNLRIGCKIAQERQIKNVQFRKLNLEKNLPFKKNVFDKILCLDILEHLLKRKKLLLEMKRVLKPGGLLFISVPNKNTSWKRLQRRVGLNAYSDPDHKKEYSFKEVKSFLKQASFKIISLKPVTYDTPWAGFIDLIGGISLKWYKKLSLWNKNKVKDSLDESTGFRIKSRPFPYSEKSN